MHHINQSWFLTYLDDYLLSQNMWINQNVSLVPPFMQCITRNAKIEGNVCPCACSVERLSQIEILSKLFKSHKYWMFSAILFVEWGFLKFQTNPQWSPSGIQWKLRRVLARGMSCFIFENPQEMEFLEWTSILSFIFDEWYVREIFHPNL